MKKGSKTTADNNDRSVKKDPSSVVPTEHAGSRDASPTNKTVNGLT